MTSDLAPAPAVDAEPVAVPYASWTRRVIAIVLDSLIISLVSFVATGVSLGPTTALTTWGSWGGPSSWWVFGSAMALFALQGWTGSTPGKKVVGIAVLSESTGRPIGLLRTIGRELAHLVDAILFVGYARPLWNERRRTFADSICATNVLVTPANPYVRAVAGLVCAIGVLGSWTSGSTVTEGSTWGCVSPMGDDAALHVSVDVPPTSATSRLGVTRQVLGPDDDVAVTWAYMAPDAELPVGAYVGTDSPFSGYPQVDAPAGSSVVVRVASSDGRSIEGRSTLSAGGMWESSGFDGTNPSGPSFRVPRSAYDALGSSPTVTVLDGDQQKLCTFS